jgi:hypothetical protein
MSDSRSKSIASGAALFAAAVISLAHFYRRRRRNDDNARSRENNDISRHQLKPLNDNDISFYQTLNTSETNLPPHILREIEKERRRKSKEELLSMKSPMYDNVFSLDPDGKLMCTISMKKARWYIRKGIAEWCDKDGVKIALDETDAGGTASCNDGVDARYIRLLFKPKGGNHQTEGSLENLYLRTPKQNVCVSCGDDGHHMRHFIVPYSYRNLLTDEYKSHMSHDIVILCPTCHVNCEKMSKKRMRQMEDELRSKRPGDICCSPVIDDQHLHHVRSCAIALVKWKKNMPHEKVESHERVVREYLASIATRADSKDSLLNKEEELTKFQLQSACGVNYRVKNPEYVSGSELVVQSMNGDPKTIEQFIVGWRNHFVDTVRPKFMPLGWSVDSPVVCGRNNVDIGDDGDGVKRW